MLLEGGHLIADRLLGIGRRLADRCSHFLKYHLSAGRKLRDITVDVLRFVRLFHIPLSLLKATSRPKFYPATPLSTAQGICEGNEDICPTAARNLR